MIIFVWRNISLKYIKKHAQLKAYETKAWPHYRQMKAFMPGTQPCGTHAFDPNNSSSQSAIQILNVVDAEEDEEEDQVGPPFDSPISNVPAAAFVPPDFEITSVQEKSSLASSLPPPDHSSTCHSPYHSCRNDWIPPE